MYTKNIICLANSTKKYPSRCIAGKEVNTLGGYSWVRPVTSDVATEGAIPLATTICADGSEVRLLDIVEVPFLSPTPKNCQTENHLVAHGKWLRQGRVAWADLPALVDDAPDLWGTGNHTRHGLNDAVTIAVAANFHSSLCLIKPEELYVVVKEIPRYGEAGTKKAMRGSFVYKGIRYLLKITDPWFTNSQNEFIVDQQYTLDDAYIVVSLADVFNGNHYKVIAAIIIPERAA